MIFISKRVGLSPLEKTILKLGGLEAIFLK